jgi:hypothetical protein
LKKNNSFLNPPVLIAFLGLLVFISLMGLRETSVDNSIEVWFVEGDPALEKYRQFVKEFGNDEVIVSLVTGQQATSEKQVLQSISQATAHLEKINGLSTVASLTNLPLVLQNQQAITIDSLLQQGPGQETLDQAFKKIKNLETTRRFLANHERGFLYFSWMAPLQEIENQRDQIIRKVDSTLAFYHPDANIYHGGSGVLYNAINQETIQESSVFSSLSFLILILVIFLVTRRFAWVGSVAMSIAVSLILLFGAMAWAGTDLNLTIVALSPLVMVICLAISMHVFSHMPNEKNGATRGLEKIKIPLVFNVLTTAGGFFSLAFASMKITREYGLYASLGVIITALVTVTVIRVIQPGKKHPQSMPFSRGISLFVARAMRFATQKKYWVLAMAFILVVLALTGTSKVVVGTNSLEFLPEDHETYRDSKRIEQIHGGFIPLDFVIEKHGQTNEDELLRKMGKAQDEIEQMASVHDSYSMYDINTDVMRIKSRNALPVLPGSNAEEIRKIAREARMLNEGLDKYRLSVFGPNCSAQDLIAIADQVESILVKHIGSAARVQRSGYLPLYSRIISNVLDDQVKSFSIALVVIILLMSMLLKSRKLIFLAIPANLLPILFIIGTMGYAGIWLDIGTVTVTAALLGLIVDDTIHLLYFYKKYSRQGLGQEIILDNIANHTGKAIFNTTLIVILGFGMLCFSGAKTIANTGFLIATGALFAFFADIFILPALLFLKPSKSTS